MLEGICTYTVAAVAVTVSVLRMLNVGVLPGAQLLRELFAWEPSARLADAYERLMVNGLLGTQLPGEPGRMTYMTPLGAGTSRRRANFAEGWGEPEGSFWCARRRTASTAFGTQALRCARRC